LFHHLPTVRGQDRIW